jgi:hypothetical protein
VGFRYRRALAGTALVAAVIVGASATRSATTRQGINFNVSEHAIPLYLKAFEFADRSAHYAALAREITSGARSEEERVRQVFDWTIDHVKPIPEGLPVVDDHIWNIIIRGYGTRDQQADVFTALSTYAGIPAFWKKVGPGPRSPGVLLSFAKVGGRWVICDVGAAVFFRTADGRPATLEDLRRDPGAIPSAVASLDIDGLTYREILAQAVMPPVPRPLRAELQMPSRRLWYEVVHVAGIERDHESER